MHARVGADGGKLRPLPLHTTSGRYLYVGQISRHLFAVHLAYTLPAHPEITNLCVLVHYQVATPSNPGTPLTTPWQLTKKAVQQLAVLYTCVSD